MLKEKSDLRLYVDSADVKDWKVYLGTGIFYGVTTNPKLIKQAGIKFEIDQLSGLAHTAFDLGANEIHMQVWGRETENMLKVGRELAAIDSRVMVKVPINLPGILCAKELINEGVNVTLTAVHTAEQVIIAAALGARYAAPYLGRMTDSGSNGLQEVVKMGAIGQSLKSPLRVLVASIRKSSYLAMLAVQGLNAFTIVPSIIDELLENELTDMAVESFESVVD
ncbi:MAG: hypothetical protein JEZ06_19255 [Anaerolineaceae bacterium]|nr:hypothetical protein [Anaerolineaceae bacterium]